jgi:hypothetical protein
MHMYCFCILAVCTYSAHILHSREWCKAQNRSVHTLNIVHGITFGLLVWG